jgi:sortase A
MARDRRPAEELSIQELEQLLARKKRAARRGRLDQFRRSGRVLPVEEHRPAESFERAAEIAQAARETEASELENGGRCVWLSRLLLGVEILAVVGFAYILLSGAGALRQLNAEVAEALSVGPASPTPLITAVVLPSGHTPPTDPGGARPNEAEIPEHLRPIVQSMPSLSVPTPGPAQARSIFIPKLWNDAAPVVQGDGWEQLKKGVGQHIGSADPGKNGNMVLSAHNDIFGELFRDLDKLKPGDEIRVQTSMQEYTYRVTGMRIVNPTEVSVMAPTAKATVTLISCYPYLVDTERIVVFGELVES